MFLVLPISCQVFKVFIYNALFDLLNLDESF